MVLGGLALALSRLIDNSVVVLDNIFRHMELGESPVVAAELRGKEVQLAVLAATVSTCIVFFPVALLYVVSEYLFTALALAVVLALFASFFVAMTVIPLLCAKFIKLENREKMPEHSSGTVPLAHAGKKRTVFGRVIDAFNAAYGLLPAAYD